MFRRRHGQHRFLLTISVLFILFPLIVMGADKNRRSHDGSVEGWVSSINREVLYIDGQEYRLSENARVFIGSESGWEVTLTTITGVGYIDKARIHVDKGLVQRIVILEVQQ
jgi:hypothetical protein